MESKWSNSLNKVTLLWSEPRCKTRTFWLWSFTALLYCICCGVQGLWSLGEQNFCGLKSRGNWDPSPQLIREEGKSQQHRQSWEVWAVHMARTWDSSPHLWWLVCCSSMSHPWRSMSSWEQTWSFHAQQHSNVPAAVPCISIHLWWVGNWYITLVTSYWFPSVFFSAFIFITIWFDTWSLHGASSTQAGEVRCKHIYEILSVSGDSCI